MQDKQKVLQNTPSEDIIDAILEGAKNEPKPIEISEDLSVHPNEKYGKPTRVYINCILQKIGTIDVVNSQAYLRIKFNLHWFDPRLRTAWDGNEKSKLPGELWGPRMDCLIGTPDFTRVEERPMSLRSKQTGHLLRTFIWEGNINNTIDLKDFPMENGDVDVNFICVSSLSADGETQRLQNETHVEWCNLLDAPDDIKKAFPNERFFNIAIWNKLLTEWTFESYWYLFDKWKAPSGIKYPKLHLKFRVFRKTGFYLTKIFVPLNLLFVLSMMIFAFEPTEFSDRINIGASCFLAAMAFLYVISADLPRVGYLTRMDYCVLCEMVVQLLAIIESLFLHILSSKLSSERAFAINWIFAALLFVSYQVANVILLGMGYYYRKQEAKKAIYDPDKLQPDGTYIRIDNL